ncbi:MAG: acyl-CoA dehydrogenase family protein [Alphaproteobacteria bacterium]
MSQAAELIERARAFRREVVDANAAAWERERKPPLDALRMAAEAGFLGTDVPVEAGGLGLGFAAKLAMVEAIAEGDMPFSFSLVNTHNCAAKLARDGTGEHRATHVPALLKAEKFGCAGLTEPNAGSDFAAIQTMAKKVDGGWVLNGEKAWITNAAFADLFVVYAQTDPGSRGRGIACFLVEADKPGFERQPAFQLFGGHAIGAGGFAMKDYFVADKDVLHPPGEAFKAALGSINGARTYVAGMCCAMLKRSLAIAVAYGQERETFGQPLLKHQGWRWQLADVANDWQALRLLTDRACSAIESGGDEAILAAAQAKKFCARVTVPGVTACIQAMGAYGLRDDVPLGRHLAGAKIAAYVDGSTEIQNERIGAALPEMFPAD